MKLPWMKRGTEAEAAALAAQPRLPAGQRVYAIGDIHGRADLLQELIEMIRQDMTWGDANRHIVVYLGDYIDRGDQTAEVLDIVAADPFPEAQSVHLIGNHEAVMLQFLHQAAIGREWIKFGGEMTLAAYGARLPSGEPSVAQLIGAQEIVQKNLPPHHLNFLRSLKLGFRTGDYLFVHAGIRPGVAVEEQTGDDLIWIRQRFLESDADHGYVVVHGHTPSNKIESHHNRIGIDTGAYYSGRLTAAVLEGATRRFLST